MERMKTDAFFSPDRLHRYALWRTWDDTKPTAMFVCLNPSTADEVKNDPTVTRCIRYARDWGYGRFIMANIFAYRATDPTVMKAFPDPIGPENDAWLRRLADESALIVAAWGNHGEFMERGRTVAALSPKMVALKVNKSGHPSHPLYLRASLKPQPFLMDN